ncbi:MAG TPA: D-2-hydroxyacid dehydrogenase [Bacillales bacterium]|nr:D-2-hydroxyacid dehydrogenase [Bacillales bacterium]
MLVLSSGQIRRSIQKRMKETYPDVDFSFHQSMEAAEPELADADILITYGEDLNGVLLEKATKLRWVMVISAGIDEMPLPALKEKGIMLTNARGIHKIPMAEYAIGMFIQTVKKAKTWYENERQHVWDDKIKMGEITGKTLAVIGTGAIGSEIARLAKAFRMTTIGVNRDGRAVEFFDRTYKNDDVKDGLKEADFVVSVLPHTEQTHQFLQYEHFQTMKNDAVFMNIGRGRTINEKDLEKALRDGEIAHAVLDVFETEPLPARHPFWDMEQVTISPHLSATTPMYQHRAFEIFEHNLKVYLSKGSDFWNVIDYDRGY